MIKNNTTGIYCNGDFSFNKYTDSKYTDQVCCSKCLYNGVTECTCGEQFSIFHWIWANENFLTDKKLSNGMKDVVFHPYYSTGITAVRGDVCLKQNEHYYWEIKILTRLYGTDVMIGFMTSEIAFENSRNKYCNALGLDSKSWGYSYNGYLQYNQLRVKYGSTFGLGTLIGVHVDMYRGTIEYYLNRKALGVAFRGLKNMEICPLVSSTAARTAIRLTCSTSAKETLQMLCLQVIAKHSQLRARYRCLTSLTKYYDRKYLWINTNTSLL